jgi:hypothetical protein
MAKYIQDSFKMVKNMVIRDIIKGFGKFKEHSSVYEGEFSLNQRHGKV